VNRKICYENKVLLKKIIEIENKPSTYHPFNVQVKYCPAFDKTNYNKNFNKSMLLKENKKYAQRIASSKPTYSTSKTEHDFEQIQYMQHNMAKNSNNFNPNLNFYTPADFMSKLDYYLSHNKGMLFLLL